MNLANCSFNLVSASLWGKGTGGRYGGGFSASFFFWLSGSFCTVCVPVTRSVSAGFSVFSAGRVGSTRVGFPSSGGDTVRVRSARSVCWSVSVESEGTFVPSTYFEQLIEHSLLAFVRTLSDSFSLAHA